MSKVQYWITYHSPKKKKKKEQNSSGPSKTLWTKAYLALCLKTPTKTDACTFLKKDPKKQGGANTWLRGVVTDLGKVSLAFVTSQRVEEANDGRS